VYGSTTDTSAEPARPRSAAAPILFLAIDAIPWDLARELWSDGALPGFCEPRPMISVFPSLTNVAVPALIQASFESLPFGYEARYIDPDSGSIEGGLSDHKAQAALARFHGGTQGILSNAAIYLLRRPLAYWQARWITRQFLADGGPWLAYISATDGVAHLDGRRGLQRSLREIFGAVTWMRREYAQHNGIEPHVVLCSDHGMAFSRFQHLASSELAQRLADAGYPVGRNSKEGTVLLPLGDVGAGFVYTRPEHAEAVALVVAGSAGVDLAVARSGDGCMCFARRSPSDRMESARIRWERDARRAGEHYRYEPIDGDPLQYVPLLEALTTDGLLENGWAPDRALFEASLSHTYPDALARIRHGLTDLVRMPAQVLFSMRDSYTYGPPLTHIGVTLLGGQSATHGALSATQSTGFAASTFTDDPWNGAPALRPCEVFGPWQALVRGGAAPFPAA